MLTRTDWGGAGQLGVDLAAHLERKLKGLEPHAAIDDGSAPGAHARDEALDLPVQRLDRLHLNTLARDLRATGTRNAAWLRNIVSQAECWLAPYGSRSWGSQPMAVG